MSAQIVQIVSAQKRTAIVNRYAELSAQLAAVKKQLEEVKVEAINILGAGEFATASAKLTINWVSRPYLDQAKAKSFLTPGQLAECVVPKSFFDIRVKGL